MHVCSILDCQSDPQSLDLCSMPHSWLVAPFIVERTPLALDYLSVSLLSKDRHSFLAAGVALPGSSAAMVTVASPQAQVLVRLCGQPVIALSY